MSGRRDITISEYIKFITVRDRHGGNLFYESSDYHYCLNRLQSAVYRNGCAIHAYALMPELGYLLISADQDICIRKSMELLKHDYGKYFNVAHRRSQCKLDVEYSNIPVVADSEVLPYCRYVELAPVRLRLTDHPADYPWSSYGCNAMGEDTGLVSPHMKYLALAADEQTRRSRYRDLFENSRLEQQAGRQALMP